jgi:hypothetical protein
MGRAFAGTHYPPLIQGTALALANAFVDLAMFSFMMTQLTIVPMIIAPIMLWRNRQNTIALLMTFVGLISFTLLIKAKNFYYFIMIAPFLYIVVADWVERYVRPSHSLSLLENISRRLGIALLVINTALVFITTLNTFSSSSTNETTLVADHIKKHLPTRGSLIGMQFYWFDLYRYKYISWQQIIAYRLYEPNSTFDDAMTALKPDIFVIDDHLRGYIFADTDHSPTFGFDRYRWERRLNKSDIDAFLSRWGELVDEIQTQGLGIVEIYKINWDDKAIAASSS